MSLLCPTCHSPLDDQMTCLNKHTYPVRAGVIELLDPPFRDLLEPFTQHFNTLREQENRHIKDSSLFPQLPFILKHDPEWRQRTYDLIIIRRLLAGKSQLRVLDIGAWNGWLSHRLTAMGHTVTAIDYFANLYDGLGALQFYPTHWRAIQMNLEDLSSLDQFFDIIILNRCVQFFSDPPGYVAMARNKLAPGGLMILTGLAFFRDPRNKIQGVKQLRTHLNANGFDFFKEIKGYLDLEDKRKMQKMHIRLLPYSQLLISSLKSIFSPLAPQHFYGVWP